MSARKPPRRPRAREVREGSWVLSFGRTHVARRDDGLLLVVEAPRALDAGPCFRVYYGDEAHPLRDVPLHANELAVALAECDARWPMPGWLACMFALWTAAEAAGAAVREGRAEPLPSNDSDTGSPWVGPGEVRCPSLHPDGHRCSRALAHAGEHQSIPACVAWPYADTVECAPDGDTHSAGPGEDPCPSVHKRVLVVEPCGRPAGHPGAHEALSGVAWWSPGWPDACGVFRLLDRAQTRCVRPREHAGYHQMSGGGRFDLMTELPAMENEERCAARRAAGGDEISGAIQCARPAAHEGWHEANTGARWPGEPGKAP